MTFKLFLVFLIFHCSECHLKLTIIPFGKDIVLEENTDLNLTCKVIALVRRNDRYDLSWKFPSRSNANGITIYQKSDQLTVTIHKLQEEDTGQYVCKLHGAGGISGSKRVSVFVKSKKCHDRFFDCGSGLCIPKRYVCDGYVDCPTGYDEAFKLCGSDACRGKMLCEGRCISKELCCDSEVDLNCTTKYRMPCCRSPSSAKVDVRPSTSAHSIDGCDYAREIGYRNAVLYAVVGFACVVMIVSTAIIFLACRTCSRQANDLQRWTPLPHSQMHPHYSRNSADDDDFFFDDNNSDDHCHLESDPNFAPCDFIPDFGFHVTSGRSKPPPYTENNIGIPPPPYEEEGTPLSSVLSKEGQSKQQAS